MRIHTDTLTTGDFYDAARKAGVTIDRNGMHGSRSRARAFDFILSGSSNRRQNFGGDGQAATWDEWGIFLSWLFAVDPNATVPKVYEGLAEFERKTFARFSEGDVPPDNAHPSKNHRWEYVSPYVFKCKNTECHAKMTTI
jgi:hypothetical protein